MRRLPALKPGEVIQILQRAGFDIDHIHGSHYQMYHPLSRRHVTVPFMAIETFRGGGYSISLSNLGLVGKSSSPCGDNGMHTFNSPSP